MLGLTKSGPQPHGGTGQKRKSTANHAGLDHTPKNRSSLACQSCRTRKVRCDITTNGVRCTNCRLDNVECIVLASRRGKKNRSKNRDVNGVRESLQSQQPDSISLSPLAATYAADVDGPESPQSPPVSVGNADVPVCLTFDEDNEDGQVDTIKHQPAADNFSAKDATNSADPSFTQTTASLGLGTGMAFIDRHQSLRESLSLPLFIRPLSEHISDDDLAFLAHKGALSIPEPALCTELLRSYIFSVHPFMPILDLQDLVHILAYDSVTRNMSILLFQAIMFASVGSLQPSLVRRLGFESPKQARKAFFSRARLLYDFDMESDSTAVLQSLLLMSSWYGKWNERKHTWHWTGLALSVAQTMGLHREPTKRDGPAKVQRLRRRLWWSLYIRDRLIALGTRRPMRIQDGDYDVAMLKLEDFELKMLNQALRDRSDEVDTKLSERLALMCIQLVKLSICIGHVLSSQYTTLNIRSDTPSTVMVVPRVDATRADELEKCDAEIEDWLKALEPSIHQSGLEPAESSYKSCADIHWAILNMVHLTLVSVLHRAQVLQTSSPNTRAMDLHRTSRRKVRDAARKITKLASGVLRQDQIRFMPISSITALVSASLSHMLDVRSEDEDVRDASILRFHQTVHILQALRDIYFSADAAASFLASALCKAGISVQIHETATTSEHSNDLTGPFARVSTTEDATAASGISSFEQGGNQAAVNGGINLAWLGVPSATAPGLQQVTSGSTQISTPKGANGKVSNKRIMVQNGENKGMMYFRPSGDNGMMNCDTTHAPNDTTIRTIYAPIHVDTDPDRSVDSAAQDLFSGWNSSLDSDFGMGAEALNYDFYSDIFGPLDRQSYKSF